MAGISPFSDTRSRPSGSTQLYGRLEQCWRHDLNWDIFPTGLKQVIDADKVLLIIKKSSLITLHICTTCTCRDAIRLEYPLGCHLLQCWQG